MPISAMPKHLNTKEKIEAAFPDDSQYGDSWFGLLYKRYQKATKTWFAFSYRCTEWWARWRTVPKLLFAIGGKGLWRYESIFGFNGSLHSVRSLDIFPDFYLSRCQYWKRWHFAVQWPLMISFHVYPRVQDVPIPEECSLELDGKLWFAYWNHFDADLIYWMITSAYVGRNWK